MMGKITVCDVAAGLSKLSSFSLSNLSLQKVAYMSQILYSGENNGTPLFDEDFEAWDYGPVCPDLYHKLKHHGSDPVPEKTINKVSKQPLMDEFIGRMHETTARMTPAKLVAITHWQKGAWHKNYEQGLRGITIPKKDILEEYRIRTADASQS